jgi:hypothetical protein
MPLSIYATSVFQILLLLNWVIEGDFREKYKRISVDKAFLIYSVFFVVHLVGLLWTRDLDYGLSDIRIKLPIILIPLVIISSKEFSMKELRMILSVFIAGSIFASFASVLALLDIIPVGINDFRNASIFINHIRFSLMIVLSILFAAYLFIRTYPGESVYLRVFYALAVLWLPAFLIILKSLSGLVIILVLVLLISLSLVKNMQDRALRFMLNVFILFIPLFAIIYIGNSISRFYSFEEVNVEELDHVTIEGNKYVHDLNSKETENGHFVWINICTEELEREWDKLSDFSYKGKTSNGDDLRFTLIRYLTSKGLRKDAVGVNRLTNNDIHAIESGVANYIYLRRFALYPRIYEVIWEFDRYRLGHDANDKSVIQRYYYLKAGVNIAKENLLFGVGTGDVRQSFDDYYQKVNSHLREERRRKAHNQYLTLIITFGIPGMLICLLAFILPIFIKKRWSSFMLIVFFTTIALSMLDEDTLESSSAVVMFGLFYGLFVFGKNWEWKEE